MDLPLASRRLILGGGLLALTLGPARATPDSLRAAMRDFAGAVVPRPGRE